MCGYWLGNFGRTERVVKERLRPMVTRKTGVKTRRNFKSESVRSADGEHTIFIPIEDASKISRTLQGASVFEDLM